MKLVLLFLSFYLWPVSSWGLLPLKKIASSVSRVVFPPPEQLKIQTHHHQSFLDIPEFSWNEEFKALKPDLLDLDQDDFSYQLGMYLKSRKAGPEQEQAKASIVKFTKTSQKEDLPKDFWNDFQKVKERKVEFLKRGKEGEQEYRRYRFNYYNCKDPQNSDPEVKKRFLAFTAAMSATMGGLSYLTANHEQSENDPQYLQKAGYEFSFDFITSLLYAQNFGGPLANPLLAFAKGVGLDQASTLSDLFLWDLAFGQGDEEMDQSFEALKNSPHKTQEVKRLMTYLDNPSFVDAFKADPLELKEFEGELEQLDYNDPKIEEQIKSLIARDQYEKNKGDVIQTGNHSLDRWTFYSTNSIAYLFLLERLTNTIYSSICVATGTSYQQMKGAYMSSAGWFTLWYTSYQMVIYHLRDFMINQ